MARRVANLETLSGMAWLWNLEQGKKIFLRRGHHPSFHRLAPVRDLTRIAAVAFLFLGPLPLQAQATSWTPEQRAVVAIIQETAEANNAGDVQAWVSLFADDFVYLPPASPAVSTREALVEIARAGFRHDADISIDPLEIQVIGSWAFARTQVTGTVTVNPSGEVITVDSKQIVIYRRENSGDWRIARLISNSNS